MGRLHGLAGLLALAGLGALAWGVLQGDLQVALLLVVPVVYGSGPWGLLGIGLLAAAFLALFADQARSLSRGPPGGPGPAGERPPAGDPSRDPWVGEEAGAPTSDPAQEDEDGGGWFRGGGVVLLGPIPIVVGSDRRTTVVLMILAALLLALGLAWTTLGPG